MKNMIEIRSLSKYYGDIAAVQDLSLSVKEGELFAFLGVNGAGKSTTINIICGQLHFNSGSVAVDGYNIRDNIDKIKGSVGVVFQNSLLDKALTVYDNLESRAALYGIYGKEFRARLRDLSELLDLEALLKRTVGKLSGGQLRRIDIARSLLHEPKLLILDEPTTGLDPQTRKKLWSVIDCLRRDKKLTVLLTTHYMEEAAEADHVVIIDGGKISAEGTPLELKNKYTGDYITLYGADEDEAELLGRPYEKLRGAVRVSVENTEAATALILKHPEIFRDYEITKGDMDDVFLAVTGKKLVGESEV